MVPEGFHGYIFGVIVKAVQLIGGRRFLVARSGLNEIMYCNQVFKLWVGLRTPAGK